MKRKIIAILIGILLWLTPTFISIDVKANPEQPEEIEIDLQFIKDITTNLSEIINNYPTGMLPKGRAFGTWGELNASTYLYNLMEELGLNPIKEKITNGGWQPGIFIAAIFGLIAYLLIVLISLRIGSFPGT